MGSETNKVRLSELMEPATTNIDAAADFAAEGKIKEAQDCYRAAIAALNKIEADNPERAATPEFATVRNKRAYINAALDSMLLAEARDNAKAVAVTDTTELEVRMAKIPWEEFLRIYAVLTNDYRIITNRIAYIETDDEAHALLRAGTNRNSRSICVLNLTGMITNKAVLTERMADLTAAYESNAVAVARMEKLSNSIERDGVRFFDVSRKDVYRCTAASKETWPKLAKAMETMNQHLEALHGVLLESGAQVDFPVMARFYKQHVGGAELDYARDFAASEGFLQAYMMMTESLGKAKWGRVYTGAVVRVELNWGGVEPEVPQKEEDRGLVKDDGDNRPKVESRIEQHVKEERKRAEKVKKAATKSKTTKKVQGEIQKLLKEDPKSRKARMLMAGEDLRNGDTAAAKEKVRALLDEKPNDGPALNMRAAIEAAEGDLKAAEKTLDQAIQSNPRDYHAYYNMANVYLQKGNVDSARRYYETGRAFAGPKDEAIEKAVKK